MNPLESLIQRHGEERKQAENARQMELGLAVSIASATFQLSRNQEHLNYNEPHTPLQLQYSSNSASTDGRPWAFRGRQPPTMASRLWPPLPCFRSVFHVRIAHAMLVFNFDSASVNVVVDLFAMFSHAKDATWSGERDGVRERERDRERECERERERAREKERERERERE